jgi:hypothetical protein
MAKQKKDQKRRKERRSSQRISAEIMIEVETKGTRTYRRTANISLGGVGFHAPIPFRQGSQVNLTLRLAGVKRPVPVQGEVVGVDNAGYGNRVKFVDLPDPVKKALEKHLQLFQAPTLIGVPKAPRFSKKSGGNVREGIFIVDIPMSEEYRLRSSEKIIGRDAKHAQIVIPHQSISRRHAVVQLQDGQHVITDLGSTNGIHFKGKQIHSLVLKDGIEFRIGRVKVEYLITKRI